MKFWKTWLISWVTLKLCVWIGRYVCKLRGKSLWMRGRGSKKERKVKGGREGGRKERVWEQVGEGGREWGCTLGSGESEMEGVDWEREKKWGERVRTSGEVREGVSAWIRECMREWREREGVSEWGSELVREWGNEWVTEWGREGVAHFHTACGFVAMVTGSRQAVYNLRERAVEESPS